MIRLTRILPAAKVNWIITITLSENTVRVGRHH